MKQIAKKQQDEAILNTMTRPNRDLLLYLQGDKTLNGCKKVMVV